MNSDEQEQLKVIRGRAEHYEHGTMFVETYKSDVGFLLSLLDSQAPEPIDEIEIPPRILVHGVEYSSPASVNKAREEARRAAFKDCITELCIDCAEGDEPTFDAQAKWYYHDAGTSSAVGCSASKLRIRAAALEAKAEEKQS